MLWIPSWNLTIVFINKGNNITICDDNIMKRYITVIWAHVIVELMMQLHLMAHHYHLDSFTYSQVYYQTTTTQYNDEYDDHTSSASDIVCYRIWTDEQNGM